VQRPAVKNNFLIYFLSEVVCLVSIRMRLLKCRLFQFNLVFSLFAGGFFLATSLAPLEAKSGMEKNEKAEMHFQKGKKLYDQKKYKQAYPHINKAAKMGHSDAQMHLGKMFYNGWGVKHNHATGRKWHEKAAAQGNEESKRKLENMDHH